MSRNAISAIHWDAAHQHVHAVYSHHILATREGQPDHVDEGAWLPVTSVEAHMLSGEEYWLVSFDPDGEPRWGDQLRLGQHGQIESYDGKGVTTQALQQLPTSAPV